MLTFFHIEIYKYFTLLLSLIKVDLVLNMFFMATSVYFTYNKAPITAYILIDIFVLMMIICTAIYAIYCIINRYEKGYFYFCIMRILLELIKVLKAILIMNAIDANYRYN